MYFYEQFNVIDLELYVEFLEKFIVVLTEDLKYGAMLIESEKFYFTYIQPTNPKKIVYIQNYRALYRKGEILSNFFLIPLENDSFGELDNSVFKNIIKDHFIFKKVFIEKKVYFKVDSYVAPHFYNNPARI